ncbi:LacI family DNA-binding transcriptional regulator [Falsihalocynthiibacter arcticus]|uniref:LacI family transcriptional regulator n=1 Tax=Falsihalocynthiibacter arcticus TaxID=1579316 RepID=A0A126V1N7_9RHOB|nr:LacI family DNA-binding transcriptional regulator [Falsihalocynthiibacter arcticus]AML51776.1 LacI family transcriptional regulator [Falsihalocynthiibacter arcticus]
MATIYDVARVSGVSPKTVSRVINRDGAVKITTKELVERAIAELGYVPSTAARAMRSNKSGLVGLITGAISLSPSRTDVSGLPDLFIVQGIQKAMEESGKTLLIADTGGKMDRVPQLIRTFEEHRVEGIIYVADHHRRIELPPVSPSTKLVLANCYDDIGTPSVLPDDYRGQMSLVKSLIAKGHRRIAYLTLSPWQDATKLRTEGYRDALEQADLPFEPKLIVAADVDTTDSVTEVQLLWDAIDRVLTLPEPPTVICFGNDRMAMRAYGILRSRGLSLPDDLSVAGYDNHKLITQTLYPTLTSAELPYAAIGIRATDLLLGMIDGTTDEPTTPILVSGPVTLGNSVKDLPTSTTKLLSIGRITQ